MDLTEDFLHPEDMVEGFIPEITQFGNSSQLMLDAKGKLLLHLKIAGLRAG